MKYILGDPLITYTAFNLDLDNADKNFLNFGSNMFVSDGQIFNSFTDSNNRVNGLFLSSLVEWNFTVKISVNRPLLDFTFSGIKLIQKTS